MWKDDILSWIYYGDNNWQNNHEIRNKTNLGCSKLHLQWSHNWWYNQTVNNWLFKQHNQPLDPLIATIKSSMPKPQYWIPFLERPTSMVLASLLFKMECVIHCSIKYDFEVFFFLVGIWKHFPRRCFCQWKGVLSHSNKKPLLL